MKKRLTGFVAACCLLAALALPAHALDYTFTAPDAGDFGTPTSDDTIYEWENPNVDRSKNSALIPPGFGTPTSYLPGSGEFLTPNLAAGGPLNGGNLIPGTVGAATATLPGTLDTGSSGVSYPTVSYPNLSDADSSLIPRTIQDSGRTLTLADVQWQEAGGYYNATATYSGTASSKYATGYIATVEYKGEVTRTSCDTVIYTATFASHGETQIKSSPQPTQEPAETEAPASPDSAGMNWAVLVIPAALLLGLAGFGGWKLTQYIKAKKRGYVN